MRGSRKREKEKERERERERERETQREREEQSEGSSVHVLMDKNPSGMQVTGPVKSQGWTESEPSDRTKEPQIGQGQETEREGERLHTGRPTHSSIVAVNLD